LHLGLPSALLSSGFTTNSCTFLIHQCHMSCPFHPLWFGNVSNTWWGLQIMRLLIGQFSPAPSFFLLLRHKYIP
jgi:hypothetical protein